MSGSGESSAPKPPPVPVGAARASSRRNAPPPDSSINPVPAALASETFHPVRAESFKGQRAVARGIMLSALLGGLKIIGGVFGHSYALTADGVESVLDVFTSLVVIGSLRMATSAPTARHPYGYGKVEPLGTLVVGMSLLIAAVVMAIESVLGLVEATPTRTPAPYTLIVLVVVVVVKEGMFHYLRRVGRSAGSAVVESDAWHQRSDALTSLAAFVGISVALIGGQRYAVADDWAALCACVIIAINGARLLRRGYVDVLDVAPDQAVIEEVRQAVEAVPQVQRVEKVLLRKTGLGWLGEIHIEVDGNLSVTQGHSIAHDVKNALLAGPLRIIDVAVHVEPKMDSQAGR
ncbi:MAG: cation diffusion facilitator family transporter [Planctomycetota bacterium]